MDPVGEASVPNERMDDRDGKYCQRLRCCSIFTGAVETGRFGAGKSGGKSGSLFSVFAGFDSNSDCDRWIRSTRSVFVSWSSCVCVCVYKVINYTFCGPTSRESKPGVVKSRRLVMDVPLEPLYI